VSGAVVQETRGLKPRNRTEDPPTIAAMMNLKAQPEKSADARRARMRKVEIWRVLPAPSDDQLIERAA